MNIDFQVNKFCPVSLSLQHYFTLVEFIQTTQFGRKLQTMTFRFGSAIEELCNFKHMTAFFSITLICKIKTVELDKVVIYSFFICSCKKYVLSVCQVLDAVLNFTSPRYLGKEFTLLLDQQFRLFLLRIHIEMKTPWGNLTSKHYQFTLLLLPSLLKVECRLQTVHLEFFLITNTPQSSLYTILKDVIVQCILGKTCNQHGYSLMAPCVLI